MRRHLNCIRCEKIWASPNQMCELLRAHGFVAHAVVAPPCRLWLKCSVGTGQEEAIRVARVGTNRHCTTPETAHAKRVETRGTRFPRKNIGAGRVSMGRVVRRFSKDVEELPPLGRAIRPQSGGKSCRYVEIGLFNVKVA